MEDPILGAKQEAETDKLGGQKMMLNIRTKSTSSSLDSYPSTDGESLLDELLGDIRRSRTTSLASTPTHVSSDCDTDCVRDCGRSEAELNGMSKWYRTVGGGREVW